MHIKSMMHKIIEYGDPSAMEWLGDVFVDLVYRLKDSSPMWYKSIEYQMHKMAYGDHLTEEEAKAWVSNMDNKDGTKGAHWTWDQVMQVMKDKNLTCNAADFYAALNMMWSDYSNPRLDTDMYIQLAKDWMHDKDIGDCKTLKYYMYLATGNPCGKAK